MMAPNRPAWRNLDQRLGKVGEVSPCLRRDASSPYVHQPAPKRGPPAGGWPGLRLDRCPLRLCDPRRNWGWGVQSARNVVHVVAEGICYRLCQSRSERRAGLVSASPRRASALWSGEARDGGCTRPLNHRASGVSTRKGASVRVGRVCKSRSRRAIAPFLNDFQGKTNG
jgi:hypothetical protein